MAAVYNCIFSLQNTEKQLRLLSKLDPVLTGDYSSTYVRVLESSIGNRTRKTFLRLSING